MRSINPKNVGFADERDVVAAVLGRRLLNSQHSTNAGSSIYWPIVDLSK